MVRVDSTGRSNSLIQVRGLDKTYKRGGEEIHVLQGLNLDVDKGDFVAFMGPSGSGKTTLLNLLGGLDVPTRGSISVAGDEVTSMSAAKLTQWRARHVGFIFQMYNLIPVLTAFQNVELPLLLTKLSKSERRRHVETTAHGEVAADTGVGHPERHDIAVADVLNAVGAEHDPVDARVGVSTGHRDVDVAATDTRREPTHRHLDGGTV
ncbi:MAG TPA: ATP-binding cassette domain-containing protein, partial [Candidatus Acidoferrum sp.]|nr:ATP-binding cassette domain-containing protein [Candidatus Acidoferrum sp.]